MTTTLGWLLDHTMPLNRKERFFTGTVFPGITCHDLAALPRLAALCGRPDIEVSGDPDDCDVVFFTEYGIAESAYGPARARLAGVSTSRDTPDIVFLTMRPAPVLFAVEAKMYDRPGAGALRRQLATQREVLDALARDLAASLGIEEVPVVHRALLPAAQASVDLSPFQVMTWEEVRDAFADVAHPYWLRMLDEAIARYDGLVTRALPNDEERLSGADILDAYVAGSDRVRFVGREQGPSGKGMSLDLESGAWRDRIYQVSSVRPNNRNWFAVEEFVALVSPESISESNVDPVTDVLAAMSDARATAERVYGSGSALQSVIAAADPAALRSLDPAELRRAASLWRSAEGAAKAARAATGEILNAVQLRPHD